MAQFDRNLWFRFNGFDSKGKYMICTKGNGDLTSQFGVNRSINEEDGVGDVPVFYGVKDECPTLEMSITKVVNDEIAPFTEIELSELTRILCKKEYKAFECGGLVYYVIFTQGSLWRVGSGQGVITLNMRLSSPHAYSPIMLNSVRCVEEKEFDVYNKSTYDDFIYPDTEIKMLKGNNIIIENVTTGQIVKFEGLDSGEHIYVYNDNMKQMVSKLDSKKNIYSKSNKEFLKLPYGRNKIKITCEEAKVKLIYQNKINLF